MDRTLGQAAPLRALPEPVTDPERTTSLSVRRHNRLGGILYEYRHVALRSYSIPCALRTGGGCSHALRGCGRPLVAVARSRWKPGAGLSASRWPALRVPINQLVTPVLDSLRAFYGAAVPGPAVYRITRWGSEPLALSSYSYVAVGSSHDDHEGHYARTRAGPLGSSEEVSSRILLECPGFDGLPE
ncbi:FAD-dependent oxidoreductase [Streptomyces sp. NPDC002790]|uniref:FAD-dependent oxidoreductase n=1 Tax=Streptomyces sp. NPDC002790 TaxID=3154431 RepID=UPI00332D4CAA